MSDASPQPASQEPRPYEPKRLIDGELHPQSPLFGGVAQLLARLAIIEEGEPISQIAFSSLFERSRASQLIYTKQPAVNFSEEDRPKYLFHSDIALLFADLIYRNKLDDSFSAHFDELVSGGQEAGGSLIEIVRYCRGLAGKTQISPEDDAYLTGQLSRGKIRILSNFFLKLFAQPDLIEKEEEEKETDETGEVEATGESGAKPTTAAVPASEPAPEGEPSAAGTGETPSGGTGGAGGATPPPAATAPGLPSQPTPAEIQAASTALLVNADVRREVARFAQISLIQLEQFHGLPEGSLQNSPEFLALMTQKAQGFFATVLPQDRFGKLLDPRELTDPKERLKLIREFQWFIFNDRAIETKLVQTLAAAVQDSSDPQLQQQLEAEIVRAQNGEVSSELIRQLASRPELTEIISNLEKAQPDFIRSPEATHARVSQELWQQLQDVGLRDEKLLLTHAAVLDTVGALIELKYSANILDQLSPEYFRILFSEDIPYNPRLVEFIKEKVWIDLRAAEARKRGDVTWNAEQLFVLDKARELLNENNPEITPAQAREVFRRGVLEPVRQTVQAHRQEKVPLFVSSSPDARLSEIWEQRFRTYLQAEWDRLSERQIRDFSRLAGYDEVTVEIVIKSPVPPPEFRHYVVYAPPPEATYQVFTQKAVDPTLTSDYMPDNAEAHSSMARAGGFMEKNRRLGQVPGFIKQIGKRLRGRLSKKAIDEAVGKAVRAGASVTPAGPVGGWLARQLATEQGKRNLKLAGGATLAMILMALKSLVSSLAGLIGGIVGGIVGGIIGFFVGGPIGAIIGVGTGVLGGATVGDAIFGSSTSVKYEGPGIAASDVLGTSPAPQVSAAPIAATASATTTAIGSGMVATGTQAILGTVGATVVGTLIITTITGGAFLADFSQQQLADTLSGGGESKSSEYVTIEKRAFIDGCPNNKCENPAFPMVVTYAIVIRPKDNYTITIQELTDTLRVGHSTQGWEEEEGRPPPEIPDRIKTEFSGISVGDQLTPGTEVEFSYEETFDQNYNHATIVNTIDLQISFTDPEKGVSGEDNAITGQAIYVGNYSRGEGCWPTTGTIQQVPGNAYTHSQVDAFDIWDSGRSRPVYASFSGKRACAYGQDGRGGRGAGPQYGNHILLDMERGGQLAFAHFASMTIPSGTCVENVSPETLLGYTGNTGCAQNNCGVHLHLELRGAPAPGDFPRTPGQLALLLPGGIVAIKGSPVESCHDQ